MQHTYNLYVLCSPTCGNRTFICTFYTTSPRHIRHKIHNFYLCNEFSWHTHVFWYFHRYVSPMALNILLETFRNFTKSREYSIYSKVKDNHQYREKKLRQKVFPCIVLMLLGCSIHWENDFFQNVHFMVIGRQIFVQQFYRWCRCYRCLIIAKKISAPLSFNKYLSNEPDFSRIHLDGQYGWMAR